MKKKNMHYFFSTEKSWGREIFCIRKKKENITRIVKKKCSRYLTGVKDSCFSSFDKLHFVL